METANHICEMPILPSSSLVLDGILGRQVQISEEVYQETFDLLKEAIGCRDYFCGSVDFEVGEIECRLSIAVIVYRSRESRPDGDSDEISNLIPVWWEFHASLQHDELPNNFQFDELKKYLYYI